MNAASIFTYEDVIVVNRIGQSFKSRFENFDAANQRLWLEFGADFSDVNSEILFEAVENFFQRATITHLR